MLPIYMIQRREFWLRGMLSRNTHPFRDLGYRKTFEQDVSSELGLGVDISMRIKPKWEILPKRWIVERSLAWLNNFRRLYKDYEISVRSAQAICIIAAFHTLLKRF
mgnify:CR=1 FL=1